MSEPEIQNSPHEFKSLLLFALILLVVAIAGGLAYLRYNPRPPMEDGITYAADGSMLIAADGQEIKIRKSSTGLMRITRNYDPNLEIILSSVRSATLDKELAEKMGLTKLQVSALKQIPLTVSPQLSTSQLAVIETAYSLYIKAGGTPATITTRPTTPPAAPAARPLAGPAESGLLSAVAQLDDTKFIPLWRRVERVKQVVTAEQFNLLSKKETSPPAAPISVVTTKAKPPATTRAASLPTTHSTLPN